MYISSLDEYGNVERRGKTANSVLLSLALPDATWQAKDKEVPGGFSGTRPSSTTSRVDRPTGLADPSAGFVPVDAIRDVGVVWAQVCMVRLGPGRVIEVRLWVKVDVVAVWGYMILGSFISLVQAAVVRTNRTGDFKSTSRGIVALTGSITRMLARRRQ